MCYNKHFSETSLPKLFHDAFLPMKSGTKALYYEAHEKSPFQS